MDLQKNISIADVFLRKFVNSVFHGSDINAPSNGKLCFECMVVQIFKAYHLITYQTKFKNQTFTSPDKSQFIEVQEMFAYL